MIRLLRQIIFRATHTQDKRHSQPGYDPLLEGAIQPADYVRNKMEQEAYERGFDIFGIEYKLFKEIQLEIAGTLRFFSTDVQDQIKRREKKESRQTRLLFGSAMGIAILIVLLSMIPKPLNPFPILASSNLGFASVLLIVPILTLLYYARLMRMNYETKKEFDVMITRITSANHALETFADIYEIRRRVQEQKDEKESDWVERLIRDSAQKDEEIQRLARNEAEASIRFELGKRRRERGESEDQKSAGDENTSRHNPSR